MSSNDEKMVSVALIGCGGFSKSVQSAMAATGLYQVTTCFDVDRAAMKETAEIFGARPCDTFQQAAQADDVEAVMLITPNHLHREQTELAFAAGKHVYVEKPIANTVAEGIAMTRAARKAGKVFMVGHVTRRLPAYRLLQQYIAEGRLGTLLSAESHVTHGGGKKLPHGAWRSDPQKCPGLPLNVIGCHLVDVMNMLFGRPRQVASFHRQALLTENVDCTSTLIAYDPPVTATIVSHYVAPTVHALRIVGTDGVVEVPNHGRQFHYHDAHGTVESRPVEPDTGLVQQFEEFALAVAGTREVETGGIEGIMTAAVTEAAVISAREGRIVDIAELIGDFN